MSAKLTNVLLQKSYQTKYHELLNQCGVFWAFGKEQFSKGVQECKAKGFLSKGEKVVSIGAGGYCPESQIDTLTNGSIKLDKEEMERLQQLPPEKKKAFIFYELLNYEAFYCSDSLIDAQEILEQWGFTEDEVMAVYHEKEDEIAENSF